MADQMYLVVTLRKPVADRDEGEALYLHVKNLLSDRPDVKIQAHVTNHFTIDEVPA